MKDAIKKILSFVLAVSVAVLLARASAFVLMYGRDKITMGATSVTFCLAVVFFCLWQSRD